MGSGGGGSSATVADIGRVCIEDLSPSFAGVLGALGLAENMGLKGLGV